MSKRPSGAPPDPIGAPIPDEMLEGYAFLGYKLAVKMAEANFKAIAVEADWRIEEVEADTGRVIGKIRDEIVSCCTLYGETIYSKSDHWQKILTAIESCYRDTMADLLRVSGARGGALLR